MSDLLVIGLAVAAMLVLAVVRVVRVESGHTPLPEGASRLGIWAGIALLPPVVLSALVDPAAGLFGGGAWVPFYLIVLAAIALLASLLAQVVGILTRGRLRRFLVLALTGAETDPEALPFDPPITRTLADNVAMVDRNNVAFPRGPAFPAEVDRAGFRPAWDALDAATVRLETSIASDLRLGLGVSCRATDTAKDARSRLDTLRRLAFERGQAWAGA